MNPSVPSQTIYSWVQKMNNSAALCLQIGQYERAIKSIAKALQLSRSHIEQTSQDEDDMDIGESSTSHQASYHQLLSLDDCIHYSEDYVRSCNIHRKLRTTDSRGSISDNRSEETIRKRFLQRRQDRRNKMGASQSASGSDSPFLYKQLIQVPDLSQTTNTACDEHVHSKQIMVLSLISIFNLAVVCHLRAMNEMGNTKNLLDSRQATTDLTKALKLYEVAYNALEKQNLVSDESSRSSVQFKLILCNNLSHVHHLMGNQDQHELYLQQVLSVAMSLVDSHRPWNSNSDADVSSSGSEEYPTQHRRQHKCIDLEGFLANAAPLMTERVCADAA